MNLDEQYWTERYNCHKDGWDIGYVSTPIKEYVDQLEDKSIKILIPGAGNSHEAEYIFNLGFKNLFVCDLSTAPLSNLQSRVPNFPAQHLIHGNFFDIEDQYDLVIEQTFFCALDPSLRPSYVEHMSKIIKPQGKLVGLLFGKEFDREGPPFGGLAEQYEALFDPKFQIQIMNPCTNSIQARMGAELFIKMVPRNKI